MPYILKNTELVETCLRKIVKDFLNDKIIIDAYEHKIIKFHKFIIGIDSPDTISKISTVKGTRFTNFKDYSDSIDMTGKKITDYVSNYALAYFETHNKDEYQYLRHIHRQIAKDHERSEYQGKFEIAEDLGYFNYMIQNEPIKGFKGYSTESEYYYYGIVPKYPKNSLVLTSKNDLNHSGHIDTTDPRMVTAHDIVNFIDNHSYAL